MNIIPKQILALLLISTTIMGCGGDSNNDAELYFVRVENSSLAGVSLSNEEFGELTQEPTVENSVDGNGSLRVHLKHGPWIPEFINHLHSDETLNAVEIVAASRAPDGHIIEHSRTRYRDAVVREALVFADGEEESAEYLFTFSLRERTNDEKRVHPQTGKTLLRETTGGSTQRYLIMGGIYGDLPFPTMQEQGAVNRRNGVVAVNGYKLTLQKTSTTKAGLSLTLAADSTAPFILNGSVTGERQTGFDMFQVSPINGTNRLTLGFKGIGYSIGETNLGSAADGTAVVETTFLPQTLLTYTPRYSRTSGDYDSSSISCVQFSDPPRACPAESVRNF